jgi:hypothetical protein
VATGESLKLEGRPQNIKHVITNDEWLESPQDVLIRPGDGGLVGSGMEERIVRRSSPSDSRWRSRFGSVFHPIEFYSPGTVLPIFEGMKHYANVFQEIADSGEDLKGIGGQFSAVKEGDRWIFGQRAEDNDGAEDIFIFDDTIARNWIEFRSVNSDGVIQVRNTGTWREQDKMFIPNTMELINFEAGELKLQRVLKFRNARLNDAADKSRIGFESLGVADGTRLYDANSEETLVRLDGGWVDAKPIRRNNDSRQEAPRNRWRLTLLVANLLVVGIFAYFVWRRRSVASNG